MAKKAKKEKKAKADNKAQEKQNVAGQDPSKMEKPADPIINEDLAAQLKAKYGENASINDLTPEELHQLQLEQAIKESNDPASRLRKLKSPFSMRGFVASVCLFFVLTIILAFVITALQVDRFNFSELLLDMLDKLGITKVFNSVKDFFVKLFSGEARMLLFL